MQLVNEKSNVADVYEKSLYKGSLCITYSVYRDRQYVPPKVNELITSFLRRANKSFAKTFTPTR